MAKQNDINFYVSPASRDHDSEKSFVKKVKSRVSDLIPASISKWFGSEESTGRVREEDEEDLQTEPPLKRARIPIPTNTTNITTERIQNSFRNNFTPATPHIHYAPISGLDIQSDNFVNINRKASEYVLNNYSEPEAGPSGIKSRKLFTPSFTQQQAEHKNIDDSNINGDKNSDSDESTSDYSSMTRNGSREATISKKPRLEDFKSHIPSTSRGTRERSAISQTRSLFSDRGVSLHSNTSLSSRRPSFNASTFGSPDFVDRTLSTKRVINSPFYGGRTTYGGASAYAHRLKTNANYKNTIRNAFEVKPANESVKTENATLSKTARRILDTLEQYTSPVSEAKKIPNPSLRGSTSKKDGLLSKYTGANPYFVREPRSTPSNKELQVPTVPDLLKMKLKEKLQDSTVAVRQIATSKAAQNAGEYKLRDEGDDLSASKRVNKMKNKLSTVRKRNEPTEQEKIEPVTLPEVSLPITTLPKFDFGMLPISSAPANITKAVTTTSTHVVTKEMTTETDKGTKTETHVKKVSVTNESKMTSEDASSPKYFDKYHESFRFAKPVILLSENLKNIIASNDFVFSKPLDEKISSEMKNYFKISSGPYELKRKSPGSVAKAPPMTSGSVMDYLGGITKEQTAETSKSKFNLMNTFKPAANTWECAVCLIRNVADKDKCVACHAEKNTRVTSPAGPKKTRSDNFGEKFKLTSDMWECEMCMVRNKAIDTKCVACTSPKPTTGSSSSSIFAKSTLDGFGDKFKPSSDTWECDVCMVRNKNIDTKCAACSCARPIPVGSSSSTQSQNDGFGDRFKPSSDTWECNVCMVRNKKDINRCVACESPNSESPTNNESDGFGNSFKTKTSEWECPCCMVRNSESAKKCVCCETSRPGLNTTSNTLPKEKPAMSTFNFGINDAVGVVTAKGFTFGIPQDLKEKEKPPLTVTFPFNVTSEKTSTQTPGASSNVSLDNNKPVLFNGASNGKNDTVSKSGTVPTFTFGAATEPASSKPAFSFGISPKINTTAKADAIESNTTSTTSSIGTPIVSTTTTANISTGFVPTVKGKTTSSFVFGASNLKEPDIKTPSSIFEQVAGKSDQTATVTSSMFVNKADSSTAKPDASAFKSTTPKPLFGTSIKPDSSTSLFGGAPKSDSPAQPVFGSSNFGNATTKPITFPTKPDSSTTLIFGSGPANVIADNKKTEPNFNFGSSTQPSFQTTPLATTAPAPSAAPTFGVSSTTVNASSVFSFGHETSSTKPFGSDLQKSSACFMFGQEAKQQQQQPPQTQQELVKQPEFNFGSSSSTVAPPSGGFGFGSNANATPIGGGFNFKPMFESQQQPASIFGNNASTTSSMSAPSQPVQNGGFNFGNAPPKTGFSFGAQAPTSATGIFSFGGSNPNAMSEKPANSGFNFGSTQFNATAKPNFNFSGAPGVTPTFSADPSSSASTSAAPTERKKIRALRRTHPR